MEKNLNKSVCLNFVVYVLWIKKSAFFYFLLNKQKKDKIERILSKNRGERKSHTNIQIDKSLEKFPSTPPFPPESNASTSDFIIKIFLFNHFL